MAGVNPLKVTKLAQTALTLLQREIVLPSLITTNAEGDYKGALNDTITIRVPARTKAKSRALRPANEGARTIQFSTLTEQAIQVTLDEDIYNAVPIEDEVATLDIVDFASQVLQPQVRAVALAWEDKIGDLLSTAPYVSTVTFDPDHPYESLIDARAKLQLAGVPLDGRTLVVGSSIEQELLKSPQLITASSSGDAIASTALRDANIGKIAGFNVITSLAVPHNEGYLFHKSAFSAAWRAPVIPKGASFGQSISAPGGIALTWLQDYDFLQSRDRSLVHVYTGANYTADPADADSELELVATGGLIRAVKLVLPGAGS